MEFCLYYRGNLRANGSLRDKHRLRLHFSQQLFQLWKRKDERPDRFHRALPDLAKDSWSTAVGPLRIASLVTRGHVAELSITMLRPEAPGSIISRGGDIDNRIKTLLDGLRAPANTNEIPQDTEESEELVLCLLEDDRLVTKLTIQTEQLLAPNVDDADVVLVIKVLTKRLSELEPYMTHRDILS